MKQLFFLAFGVMLFIRCQTTNNATTGSLSFRLEKEVLSAATEAELGAVMRQIVDKNVEVATAQLKYSDEGGFYYLVGTGKLDGKPGQVGIILDKNEDGTFSPEQRGSGTGKCTYSCTGAATNGCQNCDLVIHERSKRISCGCKPGGIGVCEGTITELDDE